MRAPAKTEKSIAADAAWKAVMENQKIDFFSANKMNVLKKFNSTYQFGMTPDQAVEAFNQ